MRAPLKYLAPLILVPFLACTDTPAEPDTVEATASFDSDRPHVPGLYVEGSIRCEPDDDVDASFRIPVPGGDVGYLHCSDGPRVRDEKKDWIQSGSVIHWVINNLEPNHCGSSGDIELADLEDGPVTVPTDPNDPCFGLESIKLRLIRILTIK